MRYRVAVAEATIDEAMWAMIGSKQQVLDAVLDGVENTSQTEEVINAAAELAWRLTQAGLSRIQAA